MTKTASAGAPAVVPPVARAAAPSATAKPDPNDAKYPYGTADPQYLEDLTDWKVGAAESARETKRQEAADTARKSTEYTQLRESWQTRVTAARAKYPDFDAKALNAPTAIIQGSAIDHWILGDDNGAEMLYHLQTHPDDVARMQALEADPRKGIELAKALTLLSQRLSGSPSLAVVTGAAARPVIQPVSRPPTPVRTGAMRTSDEPPDPESVSLSGHTSFYGTPKSRRARE